MDSLDQLISNHSLEDLRKYHKTLLMDTCETDTKIRELAAPILGWDYINGDSYGIPAVEDIVEQLIKRIK